MPHPLGWKKALCQSQKTSSSALSLANLKELRTSISDANHIRPIVITAFSLAYNRGSWKTSLTCLDLSESLAKDFFSNFELRFLRSLLPGRQTVSSFVPSWCRSPKANVRNFLLLSFRSVMAPLFCCRMVDKAVKSKPKQCTAAKLQSYF